MLRSLGWDGLTSKDMVACLRDAGLDIAETVTSKRDLSEVRAQFNAWADETGFGLRTALTHLRDVDRRKLQQ